MAERDFQELCKANNYSNNYLRIHPALQQAVRIYSVAFYDISVILRSAAALFRQ